MRKELMERKNDLTDQMEGIINKCKEENRYPSEEETAVFDSCEKELSDIENLSRMEEKNNMELKNVNAINTTEVKDFCDHLRGVKNIARADGTVVIPKTISDEIVQRVLVLSPIYRLAKKYNVKGNLVIPYYDSTNSTLAMAYVTEGTDLTATQEKLASVSLNGQLAGILTKISMSLLNNTDVDIIKEVVEECAIACADFISKECLKGSTNCPGLTGATQGITATGTTAVTGDELISLQETVPDQFQADACWIMNPATRTAIRKLKDNEGRYLLQPSLAEGSGWVLLGKPVYVDHNMDTMAATKVAIYYGDMSGLAIQLVEDFNTQILRERYAAAGQLGLLAFTEFNAKVANAAKVSKLTMAAS